MYQKFDTIHIVPVRVGMALALGINTTGSSIRLFPLLGRNAAAAVPTTPIWCGAALTESPLNLPWHRMVHIVIILSFGCIAYVTWQRKIIVLKVI